MNRTKQDNDRYSKIKIKPVDGTIEIRCPNPKCNKLLMEVKGTYINTRCKQCGMWIEKRIRKADV